MSTHVRSSILLLALGSNCTLTSECSSIVGSVCESNVCKCQEGYTGSDGTTTCAINGKC